MVKALLSGLGGVVLASGAIAAEPVASNGPRQEADDQIIIVTALARSQNRLDTSVSVSTLSAAQLAIVVPRSTAEIFRDLPGVRSESSGGEGNANIAVRGLPIASGGAKYLQLQEDGLPVLQFGDITFANADIFLRTDMNVQKIEAVRGGSASTFASNSPGGVINLISKTGDREGGAIQFGAGLDYDEYRVDMDYGAPLPGDWTFHVGGFYRRGEGPRDAGFAANRGGQIKANVTKKIANGFVRLYAKFLDDRAIAYLPAPVRVTGRNGDPHYASLPGFSTADGTFASRYLRQHLTLDGNNTPVTDDIGDGMHPLVKSIGLEARLEPGDGWTISERFRFAAISGNFAGLFPAAVDSASAVATSLGGAGATIAYATGPQAGTVIANPAALNGNGLLAKLTVFDTRLNNLDNIANDLRATRDLDLGGGRLSLTGGLFLTRQTIGTDWLWTSLVSEVRGDGSAALVDIRDGNGRPVTEKGVYAYSAAFFDNCCRRSYDVTYTIAAPFAALNFTHDRWTFAGSLRWDKGWVRGSVAGADLGNTGTGLAMIDVNGNGTISAPERQTAILPAVRSPVHYDYDYVSWSAGLTYKVKPELALFARYSRGARANADRILFGPAVNPVTGGLVDADAAVDVVRQTEAGFKYRDRGVGLYGTFFYTTTEEQNFEATTQRFLDRRYRAYGIELEGSYRNGGFGLTGGVTWTDAKIISDQLIPAVVGNVPRRQARFIYQMTPQYQHGWFTVGANLIGTTGSYAQDNDGLRLPGYREVNTFVQVQPLPRVAVSLSVNNLFDVAGFTEAEDATIPANGIVRARSINGRTVSAAVKFTL
ncbi:Outer membrane receptor proteins, mostly Fe transport [Sphingomonas sp. YR710]|uniref:TonB-dependent receptor domain-containing protein n=1 Tax=Sphingomonas sp. YR710 TaxID=1882773 RepID=UPI00088FED5F|nr:TonB-dependent receptor [Sphingomonas sp. YR710]SDC47829.1 Outer membrane receptor proteins, mostly Fe transport [Sphingomonas sp. YR710]